MPMHSQIPTSKISLSHGSPPHKLLVAVIPKKSGKQPQQKIFAIMPHGSFLIADIEIVKQTDGFLPADKGKTQQKNDTSQMIHWLNALRHKQYIITHENKKSEAEQENRKANIEQLTTEAFHVGSHPLSQRLPLPLPLDFLSVLP